MGILHATEPPPEEGGVVSVVRPDPRTGRLVRSVVVTPKAVAERQVAPRVVAARVVSPANPPAAAPDEDVPQPTGIAPVVERIAARHDLRPELLDSVIKVESNYNPFAVSPKGAQGLMQLIPETARRFGVGNVFNPLENLEGGARYLRYLLDLYHDNYPLALAAYNSGEAAVSKYRGVPPYRETQNYLISVKRQLDQAAEARRAHAPAPGPQPETPALGPAHIQQIVETDGRVRYVSRQ